MRGYLGIDVGSVSTKIVFMDESGFVREAIYLRTQGKPIATVQKGLTEIKKRLPAGLKVRGVGTTGSGRYLTGVVVGADTVKNEITAHAVASSLQVPGVQTIIEIGGQDSKIIILRNGVVADFAMNTVCAAGTGSFLDQQAARLDIPVDKFGEIALQSRSPVRIAGRCAVFAESDMIHKQQMGCSLSDILSGLCDALVRNYLNNVGKGKEILAPVVFQGGVAANAGMINAFRKALGLTIQVPPYFDVMGAVGAALLSRETVSKKSSSRFKGFGVADIEFKTGSFECSGCPNSCEVINLTEEGKVIARWGDRCGKWSSALTEQEKIS
jgi:predicted CoA-substrate-specific enzyme activase